MSAFLANLTPALPSASAASPRATHVRLAGAVPLLPPHSILIPAESGDADKPLTITVTLNRTDESGFQRFLSAVGDPSSDLYRHSLTQSQLARRFGPSQPQYDSVLSWLRSRGFTLLQGSENRLTLTVQGTRGVVKRAFGVTINDYRIGTREFFVNADPPKLPTAIANAIHGVSGLANVAEPRAIPRINATTGRAPLVDKASAENYCRQLALGMNPGDLGNPFAVVLFAATCAILNFLAGTRLGDCLNQWIYVQKGAGQIPAICLGSTPGKRSGPPPVDSTTGRNTSTSFRGASQKIGLLEFDSYRQKDVVGYLGLLGYDPSMTSRLSQVSVNGGVATPGAGESEVLLDIDTVMTLDPLSNNRYVVYAGGPGTGFAQMFNAMVNDGDTVISNSWSQCEDQTSLGEAQSIDSILAQAAASGISVFNATGDSGSTCLDGSTNTVGVPADSPHATAVGGTSSLFGPGLTHGQESWWDGSNHVPATGRGGFGISRYFPRPSYQDGLTTSTGRSIPDVVALADPEEGLQICQDDSGGCPTGSVFGGTSLAAPEWAGLTAFLNNALGLSIGEVNSRLYPLARTQAFHPVTGADGDFPHIGLGSPDFDYLSLALGHGSIGAVSAQRSSVLSISPVVPADGTTRATIRVHLADVNDYPVIGKAVVLTPSTGSHVLVDPGSPSTDASGNVVFALTDEAVESVTLGVMDSTDNIALSTRPTIRFVSPAATGGTISATPTTVVNDGTTASTVTVTLKNAKSQGALGKTVKLSAGSSAAQITATGATPGVTDSNGVATFSATDQNPETVTFSATDVTDGSLPVPGSASVTFSGQPGSGCLAGNPTGQNGAVVTTGVSGVPTGGLSGIGCTGAFGLAFDGAGNLYVDSQYNGNLYKLPGAAGIAGSSTLLSNALGTGAYDLTFGPDGKLYGVEPRDCGAPSGAVVQLDTQTGAVLRTITNNTLVCPTWMAADPLTGDLFVTNGGTGRFFSNNLWRIHDPTAASPTVTVYATDPSGFTQLAFAPNGTLYALNRAGQLVSFGGTNKSQPVTRSVAASVGSACCGLVLGPIGADGAPSSVYASSGTSIFKISVPSGTATEVATGAGPIAMKAGPDGCLYAADVNLVLKVTGADGSCDLTAAAGRPALGLSASQTTAATGSSVTFAATLANVAPAAGTPIHFAVSGANAQLKLIDADAYGRATFTYSGVFPGVDTVTALAVVNGATLTSAPVVFRVTPGRSTSFLSLNQSQGGGPIGRPATLTADLVDVRSTPAVPIVGATIIFSLGGQNCTATTDRAGKSWCTLTPDGPAGLLSTGARFAGDSTYTSSSAANSFAVIGQLGPNPPVEVNGYWLAAADGGVFGYGGASFYGSEGGQRLNAPVVGMAATSSGRGYWLVASDGGIFSFGDARFFGSTGSQHINAPIVAMTATSDGLGYWLVASDGGIFSFGDAEFFGSTGGQRLNAPITAIATTSGGAGYWLAASDGGVFSFGDATFHGSTGGVHLSRPVVGIAATPGRLGYWLVASDGGIFAFGDAGFFGSTGGEQLNRPVVGMAGTPHGRGYWLDASDGGIFRFGDATFYGSAGSERLSAPMVAMASSPTIIQVGRTTAERVRPARWGP